MDKTLDYDGLYPVMAQQNFFSYLTWSDEDESRELWCTDAGQAKVDPGSPYPPQASGHPSSYRPVASGRIIQEYQLIYITRGQGYFCSGGRETAVGEGTILALFPGLLHAYHPDPASGWDEYWVGFRGAYADRLRETGLHVPERSCFVVGVHQTLLGIYQNIFETVLAQEPYYQFKAGALVMLLMAEIMSRTRKAEQGGEAAGLVDRAKVFMLENVDRPLHIEEIAEHLGTGLDRFYDTFKAYTGMPPYQYFLHLKINRAKQLLDTGNLPVKEVAFTLGFEDQYYFSRLFKSKTGITPSNWGATGLH